MNLITLQNNPLIYHAATNNIAEREMLEQKKRNILFKHEIKLIAKQIKKKLICKDLHNANNFDIRLQ